MWSLPDVVVIGVAKSLGALSEVLLSALICKSSPKTDTSALYSDFSTNQVVLKTGTILGQATADPDTLQFFGNVNDGNLLFDTPFTDGVFHNFAITMDFNKK